MDRHALMVWLSSEITIAIGRKHPAQCRVSNLSCADFAEAHLDDVSLFATLSLTTLGPRRLLHNIGTACVSTNFIQRRLKAARPHQVN